MDGVYEKMEVKRWNYGEDDDDGNNEGLKRWKKKTRKNGGDGWNRWRLPKKIKIFAMSIATSDF